LLVVARHLLHRKTIDDDYISLHQLTYLLNKLADSSSILLRHDFISLAHFCCSELSSQIFIALARLQIIALLVQIHVEHGHPPISPFLLLKLIKIILF